MDKAQKTAILSVIHHRQNPVDSTHKLYSSQGIMRAMRTKETRCAVSAAYMSLVAKGSQMFLNDHKTTGFVSRHVRGRH
jgi:hypothetical protein